MRQLRLASRLHIIRIIPIRLFSFDNVCTRTHVKRPPAPAHRTARARFMVSNIYPQRFFITKKGYQEFNSIVKSVLTKLLKTEGKNGFTPNYSP